MSFIKNIYSSFYCHYWTNKHINKKLFFFIFTFSTIINLIFYIKFDDYFYAGNNNLPLIIIGFQRDFTFIFICSIIVTLIFALPENQIEYNFFLINKLTIREKITGKILAIYLHVLMITLTTLTIGFWDFIRLITLFTFLLPVMSVVLFFYCTIIVLLTSLKNKKPIFLFVAFLFIYTLYSTIPLLYYDDSKSIIYKIIFDKYSEIEIKPIIKAIYLPFHIISSITLIYFVSPFIENK
ncbi:MAG: hypothetical protein BWY32_02789 [bacterium ADurb.Bin243]|nr:MAG: hypothetical protein BWY32_02789 [bacterium ADurb.Bin243]